MKPESKLLWKISLLFPMLYLLGVWIMWGQVRENSPWVFLCLSFAVLWGIFHLMIYRIIVRPMGEIREVVDKYAQGLFNWKVRLEGRKDDWAELGERLNRMAEATGQKVESLSKALAESQALLAGMEEGVLILDTHGRVQKVNGAMESILSHPFPADLGKHYLEVFRDPELNDLIQLTLREKKGQRRTFFPLGQPGKCFQIQSSLVQYREGGGEGVIIVFHDVTEMERLERVRQDFVANVSHELRTPLTAIRGYAEALLDGASGEPSQAEKFLRIIQRHTQRMEKIVTDLLLLSEMESPDRMLNRAPVSVEGLISSALDTFRPTAASKNQTLNMNVPAQAPTLLADPQKIHQVLLNLIGNAVSYTPEGGHILIEAKASDQGIEVSVVDDGIGIAPEHLPRIFERFYRVDKSRSREEGGTGLGLSIVRHIVDGHRGWVSVESAPGKGSRFSFFLPYA